MLQHVLHNHERFCCKRPKYTKNKIEHFDHVWLWSNMKKNGTRAHLVYLIDQYFFEFGAKIIRFWISPLLGIYIYSKK